MKLTEREKEALMETAGTRTAVLRLLDHGVAKLEADLLSTPPEASALLASRLKLEGARALRAHVATLMKPTDK